MNNNSKRTWAEVINPTQIQTDSTSPSSLQDTTKFKMPWRRLSYIEHVLVVLREDVWITQSLGSWTQIAYSDQFNKKIHLHNLVSTVLLYWEGFILYMKLSIIWSIKFSYDSVQPRY